MATSVWHGQDPAVIDQRRGERRPLAVARAEGTVGIEAGGEPGTARLLDLSIYGCRLAVRGWHDEGDRLWLRFDGGWPVAANVVWTDGSRVGCRFDEPIAGATMRELSRELI